jgi:DNA invertase Pin-like site-specific DNA recombinase
MTKACAYLPVSGASQLDGEGWGRQSDTIAAYAAAHGLEITGTYREEAVPGKTELADRPAFMEMLAALLSNGCRTIIVERLDRLAREYRVQEELVMYLLRNGLTLISADTGEDITAAMSADPMKRFIVQLQGLLAELDKNLTVAKLSKARKAVRDRGGFGGGNVPYGHVPRKATAAEIERAAGERTIAERIRVLRASGMTFDAIREALTADGMQPRKGDHWQLSTIRQIVRAKTEGQ